MATGFWQGWLRRLRNGVHTSSARKADRRPSRRTNLRVRALEERVVPASFTPGDLVVLRVGGTAANGGQSSALADTSTAAFLDEYTPSGNYVQTIAMPTVASGGNNPISFAGSASAEGELNLSTNGQYLLLDGFNVAPGQSAPDSGTSGDGDTVAEVNAAGTVNTTTALSGSNAFTTEPRGAFSTNGTNIWLAGQDGTTGGARYINGLGSPTETNLSGTTIKNVRNVEIWNGQLYIAQDKATGSDIESLGTGEPTTSGQTAATISGLPHATGGTSDKTDSFFFAKLGSGPTYFNGYDTLYVADGSLGLSKYSYNGTTWAADGSAIGASSGYQGLTASISGTTVTLYATDTAGLVKIVDSSGFGNAINGTPTTFTSPSNTAFRGVAFVPTPATLAINGLPASINVGIGGSAVPLAPSASFGDTQTSSQLNGSSLTVAITANGDNANDVLAIPNQGTAAGQIGVNGSNVTYTYSGTATTIGTFTGGTGGSSLVINFNNATLETATAIQALINDITFQTTSNSTATRTVQFTFMPSTGNGSAVSASESVNVSHAPTINAGSPITLGENYGAYTTTLTGINDGENDGNANVTSVTASITAGTSSLFSSVPSVTYTSPNSTAPLNFTLAANKTGSTTITITVTNSLGSTATTTYALTVNPITVTKTTPSVATGQTLFINTSELSATETGVTAANIVFTLTGNPPASDGTLYDNSVALGHNGTFTEADINNGLVTYVSTGNTSATDSIPFSVSDSNGTSLSDVAVGHGC